MNVVRDEFGAEAQQTNVELLKKQLEAAQARFDVGEITRTDVAQAEARLAAGLASETSAQATLKASRLAFERSVGEAPGTLDAKPPVPAAARKRSAGARNRERAESDAWLARARRKTLRAMASTLRLGRCCRP